MKTITLNNGVPMPILGFGVSQVAPDEAEQAVTHALAAAYRHIDTAAAYRNEEDVGRAIAKRQPWIVPIPGTTQMAHMLENVGATAVRFTATELDELDAAVSAIEIRGVRLPEQVHVMSGVEAPERGAR